MCKRGDIILVSHYEENGKTLPRHTFIVLDDDGTIEELKNLDFELVTSDPNLSYDISKMADSDNKNRKLIEEAASYLLSLDRSL